MPPRLLSCIACKYPISEPFFSGGNQTLATLGWPSSYEDARSMKRLPLNFVQCVRCRHVWNKSFSYAEIPYASNPNRMFNRGVIWQQHLSATVRMLKQHLLVNPTVVEIGCGDGHFLRSLASEFGSPGRYIGFDPNSSPESGQGVEFHSELFDYRNHFRQYKPDLLVVRHVLEHLENPLEFLQELSWGAVESGRECHLFVEVPCIDNVFKSYRLSDFFYEHVSNFTSTSFNRALSEIGHVVQVTTGYENEVIYGLVKLQVPESFRITQQEAESFHARAYRSLETISHQMNELYLQGKKIVIWGGTGKAASFIQYNNLDAARFPLVVDSDPGKVGTFVPGTGQEIKSVDALQTQSLDVVIIPMHWRVNDIREEMRSKGLVAPSILTELSGQLVSVDII